MSTLELKGLKGLRYLNHITKETIDTLDHFRLLPIDSLVPGKFQPRKQIDQATLLELAASIKSQGILQPLIVREVNKQDLEFTECEQKIVYEILAGERRWQAAKLAKLSLVPAIIKNVNDHEAFALAIIENIQREDLNPLDQALALAQLKNFCKITHLEMARMLGKSRASITNSLRLLSLNEVIKQFLKDGKIEMGHARALLPLSSENQLLAVKKIISNSLTVRETEILVQSIKSGSFYKAKSKNFQDDNCKNWSKLLADKVSNKVIVRLNKQGKGKIFIQVDSIAELEWLIEHIKIE